MDYIVEYIIEIFNWNYVILWHDRGKSNTHLQKSNEIFLFFFFSQLIYKYIVLNYYNNILYSVKLECAMY